jgi:hypothetical protein
MVTQKGHERRETRDSASVAAAVVEAVVIVRDVMPFMMRLVMTPSFPPKPLDKV